MMIGDLVTTSGLLLTAACIILAIWDMIAVLTGGVQASESSFIRKTAQRFPLFVFAVGVLVGHFFAAMVPGV